MLKHLVVTTAVLASLLTQALRAETIQQLGEEAWAWRAITQPSSGDDIPRIARPPGWVPDWSAAAMDARYTQLATFEKRWRALADAQISPESITDYQLIRSLLARVRWELDHTRAWQRQPHFYISQALTPIFEALLPPPPLSPDRVATVRALLQQIPHTLAAAERNLADLRAPFVKVALSQLERVPETLAGMHSGLANYTSASEHDAMQVDIDAAQKAFRNFGNWLREAPASLEQQIAVGRESYQFFLNEVALYPYTPEQLTIMGAQEWQRTAAFEALEVNRNRGMDELPIAPDVDAVIKRLNREELVVREFLRKQKLLTVPKGLGHYQGHSFPEYLKPVAWLGRTFDLTNQHRLDSNATVYLPDPSPELGFFNLSIARDPRPIIVHEGVPGHYFQLALSWRHSNALRRHYYDSGANEGTGFYAEEMMLQAGYFDGSPKTREVIYTFARFRALRVEVDVKLAMGEFTIDEAANYLQHKMGLDRGTAVEEAIFFAATPGQAISYQIGKLQTLAFMSAARAQLGDRFNLQQFHDYLWLNGNVPIALLQAEYLALNK